MSHRDRSVIGRAFDLCIGALLAAMALYAAVQLIRSIWLTLCLIVLGSFVLGGAAWFVVLRSRRF